jgi:ketosteroid isomerase-like protein
VALLLPLIVFAAGSSAGGNVASERKAIAERFFRGVYACDPTVVDDLAGDDIVVSYPIFEKLFDTSAIRGRKAVKDFATGFCERWEDARITIHEAVVEGDRVVLVWSFQARNVGSAQPNVAPTNEEHSWGGITLYRFDEGGKIVAEIGEESAPGPLERVGEAAEVE